MLLVPNLTDMSTPCRNFGCAAEIVKIHSHPALFTQYSVVDSAASCLDAPRQDSRTLSNLPEGHAISMTHLAVDLDLKDEQGHKREWETGEYGDWLATAISDPLGKLALIYPTRHGARLIWELVAPYVIADTLTAQVWSGSYTHFLHEVLTVQGPTGEKADTSCRDWSRVFFLPRREDGVASLVSVHTPPQGSILPFFPEYSLAEPYIAGQASPSAQNLTYAQWRTQYKWADRLKGLSQNGVYRWGVANTSKVTYTYTRALGTNINALLGDRPDAARTTYLEWCHLVMGDRYQEHKYVRYWKRILESGETCGPCRYSVFGDGYSAEVRSEMLGGIDPQRQKTDSLAQTVLTELRQSRNKKMREIVDRVLLSQEAFKRPGLGPYLSAPEVYALLDKRMVGPKDAKVPEVLGTLANIKKILSKDKFFEEAFRLNIGQGYALEYHGEPIDKGVICDLAEYLSGTYKVSPPPHLFDYAIMSVCKLNTWYEPQEYLHGLVWDGVDRVPEIVALMNARNPDYAEMIMRKWMVASVVRPYRIQSTRTQNVAPPPGMSLSDPRHPYNRKVDNVLIFQGDQAAQKSTFMATICPLPHYFLEHLPPVENADKDASSLMIQKWLAEWGEFEHIYKKSSVSAIKAFVTRQVECFRPAYGKTELTRCRTATLVGSTNTNVFLNDPTGSRRFWVLRIEARPLDVPRLEAIRDQFWAQAVAMLATGECWWLSTPDEIDQHREANLRHQVEDPTRTLVLEYMEENDTTITISRVAYMGGMTLPDMHRKIFHRDPESITTGRNRDLTETLYRLGFERRRIKKEKKNYYVWIKSIEKVDTSLDGA